VNRTVGLTLRRTAGGGVIFALGFGAISAGPHQLVALSAPAAVPKMSPVTSYAVVLPRPERTAAVIIYTQAVSEPTPTPAPPAPVQVTQGVDLTATSPPAWY